MTVRSNTPIRPKDRFLVFGAPLTEDAEIQEVVATLQSGGWGATRKPAGVKLQSSLHREHCPEMGFS